MACRKEIPVPFSFYLFIFLLFSFPLRFFWFYKTGCPTVLQFFGLVGSQNRSKMVSYQGQDGLSHVWQIWWQRVWTYLYIHQYTNVKYSLEYSALDEKHLFLKGLWNWDSIKVCLNKYDLDNHLLHKEKFKWISN